MGQETLDTNSEFATIQEINHKSMTPKKDTPVIETHIRIPYESAEKIEEIRTHFGIKTRNKSILRAIDFTHKKLCL